MKEPRIIVIQYVGEEPPTYCERAIVEVIASAVGEINNATITSFSSKDIATLIGKMTLTVTGNDQSAETQEKDAIEHASIYIAAECGGAEASTIEFSVAIAQKAIEQKRVNDNRMKNAMSILSNVSKADSSAVAILRRNGLSTTKLDVIKQTYKTLY